MLFLVLVSLLVGQSLGDHCCGPMEWEGKLSMVVGSYASPTDQHFMEGGATIWFDANKKIIVEHQSIIYDGVPVAQKLIMEYSRGIVNIINVTDNSCGRAQLTQWEGNCIPDSATYVDIYFGMGRQQVKAKSSIIDRGTYQIYMTVAADTCLPINEDVMGTIDNRQVMERFAFVNVSSGISDRSVFTIPASCNSAIVGPNIPMLGRRSLFR